MTVSALAEAADLVLGLHPPTCPHRDAAERFALELLAANPAEKEKFKRRRRAALVWLSTAPAGCAEVAVMNARGSRRIP